MERDDANGDFYDAWTRNLRGRREELRLTQVAVATAVGVSQVCVSGWERGRSVPSDTAKIRLSEALGCSVQDLFPWPAAS